MNGILEGMRVIEASAFVAAPLGGLTLAQMGADVIRIDSAGGGLDYKRWPVTADNQSLFWAGLNKSKRSVAINFRSPEGAELANEIITAQGADAGILLTNFPPKGWLSYEELVAKRADLIQLTIQGDRHGGSAVDYTVNPAIGLPFITGSENNNEPVNHILPAWDCITGQMAAMSILAAERHRSRTGKGQHVKIALADVAMAVMGHLGLIAEAELGIERGRYGNYLFGAFGRDFRCADGVRVMVIGLTPKQWKSLCTATDSVAQMIQLGDQLGLNLDLEGDRFKAREAISEIIATWISARPFTAVEQAFDQQGVCWSRYQTVKEMVDHDPDCSPDNPMFNRIQQTGIGEYLAAAAPASFSAFERSPAQPAPRLGQHTDEVLAEVVGMDSATIGRLHDQGVIQCAS
jgi:2-methylfumaryl-CoA isomerase